MPGGDKQWLYCGHDPRLDLLHLPLGIDHVEEVILDGMKNIATALERFPAFEFVAFPVADPDSLKGGVEGEIQQEKEVGTGSEFLINPADFGRVKSPLSLVGHG